jgi:hypothetical protein
LKFNYVFKENDYAASAPTECGDVFLEVAFELKDLNRLHEKKLVFL